MSSPTVWLSAKIGMFNKIATQACVGRGGDFVYYYQRLRDLREDHDKTQSDIAAVLNMKYQQYARYESGEREIPLHHMITLSRYYNVSLDYLAGLTNTYRTLDGSPYRVSKNITITQSGSGKINIKN